MFDEQGSHRMYANILLSTDGSDVARKGVKQGIALAKALNAKVTVITVTEPLPVDYGSGHASGWIPSQEELIALTQPARNVRAKCSMRLEPWRSRSGFLQKSCMFRMRTQPLRLSKQQSPEAAI
jgi:nucleotide-binding universal stress UspA family protein